VTPRGPPTGCGDFRVRFGFADSWQERLPSRPRVDASVYLHRVLYVLRPRRQPAPLNGRRRGNPFTRRIVWNVTLIDLSPVQHGVTDGAQTTEP
jgi:hypothetical protein